MSKKKTAKTKLTGRKKTGMRRSGIAKSTRPKGAGSQKRRKPYEQMNAVELAEATKKFDKPGAIFKGKNPLPRKLVKNWAARERKRGRPPIGEGSQPVQVTIERTLLDEIDQAAKDQHTTRSALVARGLRMVLATAERR